MALVMAAPLALMHAGAQGVEQIIWSDRKGNESDDNRELAAKASISPVDRVLIGLVAFREQCLYPWLVALQIEPPVLAADANPVE